MQQATRFITGNYTRTLQEAPPSIPPHTAEELYTAVGMGNVNMDEEEPSPIPPYSMEDCY